GNLAAVVGQAVQEIRQAGKVKCTPESVIDDVVDGGAAKLIAELHVVLSEFPRIVVNEMPVRVDAVARNGIGRADLGKAGNRCRGKAAIIGTDACVQSNGVGIEALILWEEAFYKTVPSQADLIHLSRVDYLHV